MSEMTIILQRLDKMQESIDGLRGELHVGLQENNKSLRAEMREMGEELRGEMREMGEELRGEMREMNEKLRQELRGEMREMGEELRGEMREMGEKLRQELRAEMHESVDGLRVELTQRMDNMEYGLGQEIQAVYEIAQQNAENIRLLMPYKSKLINVCTMADRVERLEECQKATAGVVASHSEAIRKLEGRLA